MFNTQILAGSSGQGGETQQSLKFNDDESQYLSWTPASAGNRKTFTFSAWVKRGNLGINTRILGTSYTSSSEFYLRFKSNDTLEYGSYEGGGGSNNFSLITTQVFRDASAWYHIVFRWDTTQSTAANRLRIYVNGEQITAFSTANYPSQNYDGIWNNTVNEHRIGFGSSTGYFDGYLAEVNFIDGQALDASSFGETVDGYWKAKDYAGTYGTNGFHLTFQDDVVSEGFNAVTYRGNGGTQSLSGLGLAADLVWIKERSSTSGHVLTDTVRGANKHLVSSSNGAETTVSNGLTSFDADGFSVGSNGAYNQSGETYVAWAWDAGSGSAASNTDGSITSTVKANPSYGFSVTSYVGNGSAGATVGHGLGVTPRLIILKYLDGASNWRVHHADVGTGHTLFLNRVDAKSTDADRISGVSSTTFTLSEGNAAINGSGSDYIAYCFNSVANYSSIGSYSGNGSTQTITTGFAPAFVIIKSSAGATTNWNIYDNTRKPTNPNDLELYADLSSAEFDSGRNINFTSTGFELDTANYVNNSGVDYIYMAFADTREAAFWKDVSGNNNNWTPNNLDYRDSLPDSPANNFATLNPLYSSISASYPTPVLSEGNLAASTNSGSNWKTVPTTMYMSTGKWYAEVKVTYTDSVDSFIGFASSEFNGQNYAPSETAFGYQFHPSLGIRHNSAQLSAQTFTQGDIIGLALNMDDNEIKFYKNGSLLYTATSVAAGSWSVALTLLYTKTLYANFGQDSTFSGNEAAGGNQDDNDIGDFKYAPPSGYLALCTANLPTPTIIDGSEYFNAVTYTGTGATNPVTVGFSPDFTWIKQRNTTRDHQLLDIVRGYTNNVLFTNLTNAEGVTVAARIDSRDVDGFTVSAPAQVNQSGGTYVAWNWKAGGTAVSNTDGSITSQVSANTTAGFSIVSYAADGTNSSNVGHGLSTAPSIVIQKNRDAASDWLVLTDLIDGSNDYLLLNSTAAAGSAAGGMTATTFVSWDRPSGNNMIAYCFANTDSYLKAGSYTGNGNADGTFVYTGFRPAWILFKNTSTTTNWEIYDTTRQPSNAALGPLYANLSNAEESHATLPALDILSNGFKPRSTWAEFNTNGHSYIYLAFAESPFKYANAR